MISREIKLYSTILGVLLVGAFLSWKAERSPKKASAQTLVSMLDVQPDELAAVSLVQKKDGKATKVTFEGKGEERTAWVEVVPPSVTSTSGAVVAAPPKRRFPGGDAAVKLVEQLAPLQAVRAFGKLEAKQRAQFELDDPKMELALETRGGRKHQIKVGGTAYGADNYYVEDGDGRAWLVRAGSVKPLLNGDGLMERSLHELDDKELASVLVKSGSRDAKYVHQHRLDAKARYWAKPDSPEQRETQVGTWLGKARRLPILRYPEGQPEGVTPTLSLVYQDEKGKELARFEVATRDGLPPLIRSERTRAWAESDKTRVDEILGELDAILR